MISSVLTFLFLLPPLLVFSKKEGFLSLTITLSKVLNLVSLTDFNTEEINLSDEDIKLIGIAKNYINANRLNNVLSKLSEKDRENKTKLIGLTVSDAYKDFLKEIAPNCSKEILIKIKRVLESETMLLLYEERTK